MEPIYIGKAVDLRQSIAQQLNNLMLMRAVNESRSGAGILLVGAVPTHRGQQLKRALPLVERAHIRAAFALGHPIVNKQGTRTKTHSISMVGRRPRDFPFGRLRLADA